MRAVSFPNPGDLEIVERETPSALEGHVVLRVEACGVCGTDLHIYQGEFPARFPLIPGHEFAGVVEEAGQGVASLRPGDRVVIDPNLNCGVCRPCQRGLTHLCRNLIAFGVTNDGGFATHCALPARQCHKLPADMPFDIAAMTEPVSCCVHGIERAHVRPGDSVAIIGAGLIGLIMLQLSLLQGASVTVVSELDPAKREMARSLGAAITVDPASEDLAAVVRKTSAGGADVVIDCVGGAVTSQQALDLTAEGARVLLFGVAAPEETIQVKPYELFSREIAVTGSFINPHTHSSALALLASGRLRVGEIISHRLPLEGVPRAIELLASGQARKIVLEPQRRPE